MLDEDSRLHVVIAHHLRDVARDVEQRVVAKERPAALDVEGRDGIVVERGDCCPGERGLRKQVVRVRPGEELPEARQHFRAVVHVARRLIQRACVLVRPVDPDGHLGERRLVERVEQRVHVADRVDLILARLLRPAGPRRAKEGHAAGALFIPPLQPAIRGRLRRDVPIHAQHLVVARPVLHGLENVVVLPAAGRVVRVRQGEQVQQRGSDGVEAAGRNNIAGEAGRSAGSGAAVARKERVADVDQPALRVERLREVAAALECGRHPPLVQAAGIGALQDVLREEEEQLVAALVEARPRNQDRPAQCPCLVVERVERRLALGGHAESALLPPAELVAVQ